MELRTRLRAGRTERQQGVDGGRMPSRPELGGPRTGAQAARGDACRIPPDRCRRGAHCRPVTPHPSAQPGRRAATSRGAAGGGAGGAQAEGSEADLRPRRRRNGARTSAAGAKSSADESPRTTIERSRPRPTRGCPGNIDRNLPYIGAKRRRGGPCGRPCRRSRRRSVHDEEGRPRTVTGATRVAPTRLSPPSARVWSRPRGSTRRPVWWRGCGYGPRRRGGSRAAPPRR